MNRTCAQRSASTISVQAIRQLVANLPSSAMPPSYEDAIIGYESESARGGSNVGILGGGAVESDWVIYISLWLHGQTLFSSYTRGRRTHIWRIEYRMVMTALVLLDKCAMSAYFLISVRIFLVFKGNSSTSVTIYFLLILFTINKYKTSYIWE